MKSRIQVITEIVALYKAHGTASQEEIVRESLIRMGDMNLFALASELGVDLVSGGGR